MPAATTRAELLASTEKEWARLWAQVEAVPRSLRVSRDDDDISIKDILAHRTHWIGLFFQWLDEGLRTGTAAMPDHGVKWNQLTAYNADLRLRYAGQSWSETCDRFTAAHERLTAFMRVQTDDALYGGPMPGGTGWTTGRYAEAAGPSHYRSAAKYIRARLRSGV